MSPRGSAALTVGLFACLGGMGAVVLLRPIPEPMPSADHPSSASPHLATITGRIIDHDTRLPVPGVCSVGCIGNTREVLVGADGRFAIPGWDPSGRLLVARKVGFLDGTATAVGLREGCVTDVGDVELYQASRISGRIVAPDGVRFTATITPAIDPDAGVYCRWSGSQPDREGRFSLTVWPPAVYDLLVNIITDAPSATSGPRLRSLLVERQGVIVAAGCKTPCRDIDITEAVSR